MNRKRILIIEDDQNLAGLMQDEFNEREFSVEIARDGEEGMRMIETHPDLILLDIMLPKESGLTVLARIRESGRWGTDVPVIIVSNLNPDSDEILRASAAYTPMYYLVKADLSLAELYVKARKALSMA